MCTPDSRFTVTIVKWEVMLGWSGDTDGPCLRFPNGACVGGIASNENSLGGHHVFLKQTQTAEMVPPAEVRSSTEDKTAIRPSLFFFDITDTPLPYSFSCTFRSRLPFRSYVGTRYLRTAKVTLRWWCPDVSPDRSQGPTA